MINKKKKTFIKSDSIISDSQRLGTFIESSVFDEITSFAKSSWDQKWFFTRIRNDYLPPKTNEPHATWSYQKNKWKTNDASLCMHGWQGTVHRPHRIIIRKAYNFDSPTSSWRKENGVAWSAWVAGPVMRFNDLQYFFRLTLSDEI